MSSTNKTNILSLNQYQGTDKPSYLDYNSDMAKIDSAMLGWFPLPATLTYSSADTSTFVVTTDKDLTSFISLGMKIKLNHSSEIKYFIVTDITSNSITLYGGTDYAITSGSISNVYFSPNKTPFGFPMNPDKWSVTVRDTLRWQQDNPNPNQFYNPNGTFIDIPIGLWNVDLECMPRTIYNSSACLNIYSLLSTSSTSRQNPLIDIDNIMSGVDRLEIFTKNNRIISITSKTRYYFLIYYYTVSTSLVLNNAVPLTIKAVCAYL